MTPAQTVQITTIEALVLLAWVLAYRRCEQLLDRSTVWYDPRLHPWKKLGQCAACASIQAGVAACMVAILNQCSGWGWWESRNWTECALVLFVALWRRLYRAEVTWSLLKEIIGLEIQRLHQFIRSEAHRIYRNISQVVSRRSRSSHWTEPHLNFWETDPHNHLGA